MRASFEPSNIAPVGGATGASGPATIGGLKSSPAPLWSIVVPFFNERSLLAGTLASLFAQDVPFRLILIDNGSTDGSGEFAARLCRAAHVDYQLIMESRPGKVHALATGIGAVTTRWVATCDADTRYPQDYLRKAGGLLARGHVAAGAHYSGSGSGRAYRKSGLHITIAGKLLANQCHTGGAGQVFDTAALRTAGSFDTRRWNWVLEDHEIIHQVSKLGSIGYDAHFWCSPAERRRDRASIRWTLFERLSYHLCPARLRDRYFSALLGPRLGSRELRSDRIREIAFQLPMGTPDATPYPVCR